MKTSGYKFSQKEAESKRKRPEVVESTRMRKADNGGFIVHHEFESGPNFEYRPGEDHVFNKGNEALQHLAKVHGIKMEPDTDDKKKS